jgi:hypothetical protein
LKHFSELASLSLPRAITFAKKIHPTSVKPPGLTSSQKGKSPFLPRHELAMPKVKQRNIPFPLEIMHQHLIAFKTPHMKEIESTRTHLHVPPASYKKQFGHLARLPSSYDLQTSSCGHDFDVDVVYNRREDDKGYIFALTLIPKPDCSFKKMKQNVFFVIDRSSSIGQERLHTVRHAILASLPLLESEDRFNIITFDSGMEELFTNEVSVNPFTIRDARRFLLSQKVGSFFSSPKISYPLSRVLSKALREDECYSIIYLSNGATLEKGSNRRFFDEWMRKNRGRVAFYSVSLTSDKNNAILDYFSSSNKGRLFSSRTPRGIKRQLQKAVHSIHRPVANHMTAHIFLSSKDAQMKLFPSSRQQILLSSFCKGGMPSAGLISKRVFHLIVRKREVFLCINNGRFKDLISYMILFF